MRESLKKLKRILLYALPAVLFFSYYPIIPLGATSSMNLELSLPLIWLIIFTLLSIPTLPSNLKSLAQHFPQKLRLPLSLALFSFPLYLTVSIIWSPNPLRATLTAGIFWCLIITILTIPNLMLKKNIKRRIVKITIFTSVIISAFCWLQCILDIMNVPRDVTLLCRGCTYRSFGFPHPSGFAIEPQFMGNLLLAPCFLAFYLLLGKKTSRLPKALTGLFSDKTLSGRLLSSGKSLTIITLFLVSTLFLTFSRGAIYAFLLGSAGLIIANLVLKNRRILWTIPIILCSFILSLLAQGTFAQLSPTTDTFASGIAKVISQLTLGNVDLNTAVNGYLGEPLFEERASRRGEPETTEPRNDGSEGVIREKMAPEVAYFDGYVEESTEVRVNLTNFALSSWQNHKWFGTGLASSGTVLYDEGYIDSPKEIVQNEYAALLLEAGLVGCTLLVLALAILVKYIIIKIPKRERVFLLSLVLSYSATLFFFSGLPNALHIYLLPPLFYSLIQQKPNPLLSLINKA